MYMKFSCCQCNEEIPPDEHDLVICEECWSTVADHATSDIKIKLEEERQKNVKLTKLVRDLLPKYAEVLELTGKTFDFNSETMKLAEQVGIYDLHDVRQL